MNRTTSRIYHYIKSHIEREGFAPSMRTIAEACECALSTVDYNLGVLEDAGYIVREPKRWYGIELTDKPFA